MNRQCSPFHIFSWHGFFLAPLIEMLRRDTDDKTENAVIVFPNDRPRRYITRIFSDMAVREHHPFILPLMLTSSELIQSLYTSLELPSYRTASTLDCVYLLWKAVQDVQLDSNELASMNESSFFPWGVRLARVLEECMSNDIAPTDIAHAENDVAPFAAQILASLRTISEAYIHRLDECRLLTDGLASKRVVEHIRTYRDIPNKFRKKNIYLAGFNALNGSEEKLFRILWDNGAQVCFHADPLIASSDTKAHYSCRYISQWIRKWGAECELETNDSTPHTIFSFFAGHDLHSQLSALQKDFTSLLNEAPNTDRGMFAVTLTHEGALLPVLHTLPSKDCNVSLGYPLSHTLLAQLIDGMIGIGDDFSVRKDGTVRWNSFLRILRHPYLRMLSANGQSVRNIFAQAEALIREGNNVFIKPNIASVLDSANKDVSELALRIIDISVKAWASVQTPRHVAQALQDLYDVLTTFGGDNWSHFPLDSEGLFRLNQHIIPSLRNNLMADKPLQWSFLRLILQELIEEERIPFEADPITGVQVLGMLETRLLRFDHVFLVDATEDHLPGTPADDPLLPNTLRSALGLPDTAERDSLAAYTFYRLLAGAKHVWIYWQQGIQTGKLFDGRKRRSRFIEELIWKEEQKRREILKTGTDILRAADTHILCPPSRRNNDVVRKDAQNKAMAKILNTPLAPTVLKSYIECPLAFYYKYICRIEPLKKVREGDDPKGIGDLLHAVLQRAYKPFLDRCVSKEDISEHITAIFEDELNKSGLENSLPPENAMMLRIAGPHRLYKYLTNQPSQTKVIGVEEEISALISIGANQYELKGRLDRIDERGSDIIVLDYKTGSVQPPSSTLWKKNTSSLWASITDTLGQFKYGKPNKIPDSIDDPESDILACFAKNSSVIQLATYIYLTRTLHGHCENASFVELNTDGKEISLISEKTDSNESSSRQEIIDTYIPNMLSFILLHMKYSPIFHAYAGKHCEWCPSAHYCGQSTLS